MRQGIPGAPPGERENFSMTETEIREPSAELAAALAAVQAELPEVKKNRTAKVEKDGRLLYTYDYADLADVSAAILPILGKHGLSFTALPGHWPDGKFGLRYSLLHKSGASRDGFYEIADQGGMQMVGGRITYARRCCLCAVTGVAAEEDVDARGDSQTRSQRRQQPASEDGGQQQPARTAQRRQRTQNAPSAPAAAPPADQSGAGGALPPLPGEEELSGPVPQGRPAGNEPAPGPDDTDYDTPGTATFGKGGQLTAIWTVLNTVFAFGSEEKEQARAVVEHIIRHKLTGGTTASLSYNEAKTVLDTLAHWQAQAEAKGDEPRDYLIAVMVAQDQAGETP